MKDNLMKRMPMKKTMPFLLKRNVWKRTLLVLVKRKLRKRIPVQMLLLSL
jgi:hypothetical protein